MRVTPPRGVDHVPRKIQHPGRILLVSLGRARAVRVYRKSYFAALMPDTRL
jgi:hypothetical protein